MPGATGYSVMPDYPLVMPDYPLVMPDLFGHLFSASERRLLSSGTVSLRSTPPFRFASWSPLLRWRALKKSLNIA